MAAPALSMRHDDQSDDELFLTLCERYAVVSKNHVALLTRAADARRAGDQDAMEEIADALDDHEAERRLLLCRIYELADPATPVRRAGARSTRSAPSGPTGKGWAYC